MLCPESAHCCADSKSFLDVFSKKQAKIENRHKQLQPKRRRIRILAMPRNVTPKYSPMYMCEPRRKTQIIREVPCMTRTEQLAYPYVRRMLANQRDYAKVLSSERQRVLNRTIRGSILSLYSRLANFQAPKEKEKMTGWTKKDWIIHRRYLKKLSTPKKIFKRPRRIHEWKDIKLMKRYKKLAKPKMRIELVMPKWELTPALKMYKATMRILFLSRFKDRNENIHFQSLGANVSPEALRYKATERIKQLATPPEIRLGESDLKENPFGISPNALKAKASAHIIELAQPKEATEVHTRANPNMISPAALKAKPSARIIRLAKPKGST